MLALFRSTARRLRSLLSTVIRLESGRFDCDTESGWNPPDTPGEFARRHAVSVSFLLMAATSGRRYQDYACHTKDQRNYPRRRERRFWRRNLGEQADQHNPKRAQHS